jgi:carbonic anhydrase
MKNLNYLFENNKSWAKKITQIDPEFFKKLSRQQSPEYLWIGCSDSRVPANEIVGLLPGELFVHRNVANLVVHTDLNCLSVIHFAVEVLKVKHIIVCGHYGCGGAAAVLQKKAFGLIENWLRHLEDVYNEHKDDFPSSMDDASQVNKLCELNVISSVNNVCRTTIVQEAWKRGQELTIHGWIYGIRDGLLKDLVPEPIQSLSDFKKHVGLGR